jgi:murein L,D-transpeptidase YcbB/YkuD
MYYRLFLILVISCEFFGVFFFSLNSDKQENTEYLQLKQYLSTYQEIKNTGGWPSINEGEPLKLGIVEPRVIDLKRRLIITKELTAASEIVSDTFDTALKKSIEQFQKNHGLIVTGIADTKTIKELNVSIDTRIRQIELNMERWKQMPIEFEKLYVLVNIAAGNLDVMLQDSSILKMKVIVGRLYRKTPVFNASMTHIEFNPYWVIPPGIMKKDILPKLKKDPTYLETHHMQVFENQKKISADAIQWGNIDPDDCSYKIIQSPGLENPMGVVKFTFPNKHYVYMHDTPAKNLFESSSLTFSSGCIRLSKAVELAKCILKMDNNLEVWQTDSLIGIGKNYKIYLNKPIKVYISYFTAWVNKNGDLQFASDIYKRDILKFNL